MAYGSILTAEVDSNENRKGRGAFFTPPELSDAMCRWAIRDKKDRILEPSFGEGRFLISAGERLGFLAGADGVKSNALCGFELHSDSVNAARALLRKKQIEARLVCGDFLEQKPQRLFNAVIGNPPYVRFQSLTGEQRKKYRDQVRAEGVTLSGLASLWAPFLIHSTQYLKKGGRLALVLPAELLSVNYAAPVRTYLLRSFSSITIETFNARVFPEVQEEVVLLYADGYGLQPSSSISWRQCEDLSELGNAPAGTYHPDAALNRWSGLFAPKKAMTALTNLVDADALCPLSDWAEINLGAVTGANAFFALSEEVAADNGLAPSDTIALCPPGSKHLTIFDVSTTVMQEWGKEGLKTRLFYPSALADEMSLPAEEYIALGEKLGLDRRYKCSRRTPWWKVPLGGVPDAFLTYMNAYSPRLCSNSSGVINLNSVHGVYFHEGLRDAGMKLLPLAFLNSATITSAEIDGRSYGGGVLKIEPGEAQRLLLPSPEFLAKHQSELLNLLPKAERLLANRCYEALTREVDKVLFGDESIITHLELELLFQGHVALRERRRARAKEA